MFSSASGFAESRHFRVKIRSDGASRLRKAHAVEYDIHHKRGVLDNTERACIAAAATAAVLVGRLSRGKSRNPQPLFVCLFVFVYAEIKILVPLGQRNP